MIAWCQQWFQWERQEDTEVRQLLADIQDRLTKVEKNQMAEDQNIQDLATLVNGYITDVGAYEQAVQAANAEQTTAIANLNSTIASLQAQLANAPSNSAAIAELMTKLTTAKADVDAKTAAANAAANKTTPVPTVPTTAA